jgi:hypothetical protein
MPTGAAPRYTTLASTRKDQIEEPAQNNEVL